MDEINFLSNKILVNLISHYEFSDMTFWHCVGIYCLKWGRLDQRGGKRVKTAKFVRAAVLPISPPLLDDEEKRKQMSESYGFTQIGEPLPDNVTLKDVMDTLPKKVI